MLEVQVMLPRGAHYLDTTMPCAWAGVIPSLQLDAFIWSDRPLATGQTVRVRPLAYCHVEEDGALSHVLLAVPENETPSTEALKQFEARMARFLHRHFEIMGWGNEAAVKNLLALRYNITI